MVLCAVLATLAPLLVVGCDHRCHSSMHIVRPRSDSMTENYTCDPGATMRLGSIGDGDRLRSAVLCDCPVQAPDMATPAQKTWR